jgi:hypothetical protein
MEFSIHARIRVCVGGVCPKTSSCAQARVHISKSKYKLIHKLIVNIYINKMTNNIALKVGIIQWDILLDKMEQLITSERCICCRTLEYSMIDPTNTFHSMEVAGTVPAFANVGVAYCNVLALAQQVQAVNPLEHRYHRQSHGHDKMFIRELLDAERNLLVAMHFHPLLADMHLCFMNYHVAARYGVELIACDEVFVTHQTVSYMKCLDKVRAMFE